MDDRTRALQEIAATARQHGITASEIAAVLGDAPATTPEGHRRAVLVRVLGFLGGTFVFAGIGVFIALQWDAMSSAARVVATLGPGVVAFVLAVLASREARFEKAATPMFLVAAALQPTGMLVTFDEFGSGGDWRCHLTLPHDGGCVRCGVSVIADRRHSSWTLCSPLFCDGIRPARYGRRIRPSFSAAESHTAAGAIGRGP